MAETKTDNYPLGRSEAETQRLIWGAKQVRLSIQRFVEDAGIESGMKVLDVGCAAGDLSLVVAEQVGPAGSVVGIDLNDSILEAARSRARDAGFANLSFAAMRIPDRLADLDRDFDAVIGRRVLCYIPAPHDSLRALLSHAKSGAVVAFQEIDWTVWARNTYPETPVYEQVWSWIYQAFEAGDTDMAMGTRLLEVFLAAGLPEPRMKAEAGVGSAAASTPFVSRLLHSLTETIVREGIAGPGFQPDEILRRLDDEARGSGSVCTGGFEVAAWSRKP